MSFRQWRFAGTDALIRLAARFTRQSLPAGDRLATVARFGGGCDNVMRHATWAIGTAQRPIGRTRQPGRQHHARRLDKAFIARDPYADPASAAGLGVELVSIEDLFRRSDFLSASCPLDDRTRGIVSACLLGEMKPTAFLINTARGPVLDRASSFSHQQACLRP